MLTTLSFLTLALQPTPQPIAPGPAAVRYTVEARDALGVDGVIPLRVSMRIAHPPARLVVTMPEWAPGSYRLRDFPDRVRDVEARDRDDALVPVERLDRETWQIDTGGDAVTFSYGLDLHDDDRFMLRGDMRRCITFEGPAVYMGARGFERSPCHVHFGIPEDWSVASGLIDLGGGRYFAHNYDFLVDCPVKLGVFQSWSFESLGARIDVVLDGPGDVEFDSTSWLANIAKITECQGRIFGGLPFDRYTFLYTASPGGGGGGLEHLTSTAIGLRASALRRNPRTGMSTTAHEFFHAWNVKRIRPVELGPFDYSRPNRTTALWLMEGVTSYYTQVTMARCGMIDEDGFWNGMGRQIRTFESNPARDHVSSADASRTVWDAAASDRSLNYYNSGLVLGLLLDIEIRSRTGNRRSLDDLMRRLYAHCATLGRGFREHELADLASEVAAGDLREFFDRYVDGTQVPPYQEILGRAGVDLDFSITRTQQLRGLRSIPGDDGVYWVDPDARNARTMLRAQGRLTALDGQPVESREAVDSLIADMPPGRRVRLALDGPFGERRAMGEVVSVPRARASVSLPDEVAPTALAIRNGIVTGDPGHPAGK